MKRNRRRIIVGREDKSALNTEALRTKVESIPENKLCEPEAYVAVPAIQQIAYCFDSEMLREMYANLLASSMNVDKKWTVHPSFVDIIKQIIPDEAKLLRTLPRSSKLFLPLVDLKISSKNKTGESTVERNIVQGHLYDVCEAPENMSSYLENLERLQLIKIPEDQHITDDSYYAKIEESARMIKLKSQELPDNQEYTIGKKLLYVTDYGLSFIRCCIDG